MEKWFESGSLSQDETELMFKLLARFIAFDVDQFEHYVMHTPNGPMFADFSQASASGAHPLDEYIPAWPAWDGTGPKWTVWREDDTGRHIEIVSYGSPNPAAALAQRHQRHHGGTRFPNQRFWVTGPTQPSP
jgi:hypothetical protein